MRLSRRRAFVPPVDLELLVFTDGPHRWLCLIAADDLTVKRVWTADAELPVDEAMDLVVATVTEGVRAGQSLITASECWPDGWDLLASVPDAVERWLADPDRWAARVDDESPSDALVTLLADAPSLVGGSSVALRIDAGAFETVYLELRGAGLVVSDSGETWESITGLPDIYRSWSDVEVRELADHLEVVVVRDEGEGAGRISLERSVGHDATADVVRAVASLVERVYAMHAREPDRAG